MVAWVSSAHLVLSAPPPEEPAPSQACASISQAFRPHSLQPAWTYTHTLTRQARSWDGGKSSKSPFLFFFYFFPQRKKRERKRKEKGKKIKGKKREREREAEEQKRASILVALSSPFPPSQPLYLWPKWGAIHPSIHPCMHACMHTCSHEPAS